MLGAAFRVVALAAAALAGCTVGPDFQPPHEATAPGWNDLAKPAHDGVARVDPATDPDPEWWNGFHDPVLTDLEKRAIAGNLNVQQAVLRIVASRQNEVVTGAAGLPTVQGTGSYTRQQIGAKGILESKGAYAQLDSLKAPSSPVNAVSPGLGDKVAAVGTKLLDQVSEPTDFYQYGLSASWELDLFGKVRRSVEQAKASTEAQMEATNDSLVMLEGQVAQAYLQVRAAQALLASQRQNVEVARGSLQLTQRQQVQGITTQLSVEQARSQVESLEAQLPTYEKQAQQAMNQLNVLVGQPPGGIDAMVSAPSPMPSPPEVVGVGVPASLARRRPDIREAEAQLHSAAANVGVATASFYPDISLMGSAGLRAVDASYLTNWSSLFYSFGPSVSLPIFQGGKLTASLRMARAQEVAAALSYRGTVLNALGEVENALVAYRTDRAARDRLTATVESSDRAFFLARNSYQHGLSDFLQVLSAEQTLVQARQQLIQSDMTVAMDVITLYNALGGGWQQMAALSDVPPVDMSTPFTPAALDGLAAGRPHDDAVKGGGAPAPGQ